MGEDVEMLRPVADFSDRAEMAALIAAGKAAPEMKDDKVVETIEEEPVVEDKAAVEVEEAAVVEEDDSVLVLKVREFDVERLVLREELAALVLVRDLPPHS